MWNWFNCYLSGRHDYSAWCESGAMFLRCVYCGRRSAGWAVTEDNPKHTRLHGRTVDQQAMVSAQRTPRVSCVTPSVVN